MLVKNGADLNFQDENSETALKFAVKVGYKNIADQLIDAGTDLNIQDENGETALICAADRAHRDIAELLIKAGADLNIQDNSDKTALVAATKSDIKVLLNCLSMQAPTSTSRIKTEILP